jgi:hypothetical protein
MASLIERPDHTTAARRRATGRYRASTSFRVTDIVPARMVTR